MHTEFDDGVDALQRGNNEDSAEMKSQSAASVRQWLSNGIRGMWKSALSATLKGWVRQEIVTQFKLAIPVVSTYSKLKLHLA